MRPAQIVPIVAGIPAEVWVAEKLPENPDDPYSTIEIFFADPEHTVQIGIETNITRAFYAL